MAEDMIERAARATFLVRRDWDDPTSFDDAPDYGKDLYRDYARAALLAALDPEDEALVEAVARAMCNELGLHADDWSEDLAGNRKYVWQKECETAREAIVAIKRIAQGEPSSQEQVREKD